MNFRNLIFGLYSPDKVTEIIFVKPKFIQIQNAISTGNSTSITQMDYHLTVLCADATSAGVNGMWSEVHPNDFWVMIIVVM